ncbi:hypothetical protein DYB25_013056, partial [Aphanomyces astaci]
MASGTGTTSSFSYSCASQRHGFSRQRPGKGKNSQEDLAETREEFANEYHRSYSDYGKKPRGSSKISCGEKHSMLMTAVLAARADGTKLPIMFIMKGQPNGRIDSKEVPTFPAGHSYGVQEKAWMDARVWKQFLRSVLHDGIEECSVVLVDNFESHMSCSLLDVRQIFDTVIEDYPDADARLGRSAVIVKNPAFEDGIVKVLLGSEASLTSVEADAIKALWVSQASQGSEEDVAVPVFSLAERALKKNKVLRSPG